MLNDTLKVNSTASQIDKGNSWQRIKDDERVSVPREKTHYVAEKEILQNLNCQLTATCLWHFYQIFIFPDFTLE